MAERVSRRLVLLSSAAIGAVYLAGYLDTRSADASLANTTTSVTTSGTTVAGAAPDPAIAQVQTATQAAPSVETSTSTSTATAAPSVQRAAPTAVVIPPTVVPPTATAKPAPTATAVPTGLRNGTYTGVGDSRRGSIQAAVTVKGGRITNVAITGASTQYPVAWISALPGEVVSTQSAQVDLVSGATYSSLAFQGAVQQALAQAQA